MRQSTKILYFAIAILATFGAEAGQPTIDDSTGCEWTVRVFDGKNLPAKKEIAEYIAKTLNEREDEIGGRMLKRLSSEGYNKIVAAPIGICDKNRNISLHQAVIEVYDALHQMQKAVGVD